MIIEVPRVTFLPAGETFEFETGKLPYKGHGKPQSLLDLAMNVGFHLEHACGGSCACTTCHIVVKEGDANLSEMDDDELDPRGAGRRLSAAFAIGMPGDSEGRCYREHSGMEPELRERRSLRLVVCVATEMEGPFFALTFR